MSMSIIHTHTRHPLARIHACMHGIHHLKKKFKKMYEYVRTSIRWVMVSVHVHILFRRIGWEEGVCQIPNLLFVSEVGGSIFSLFLSFMMRCVALRCLYLYPHLIIPHYSFFFVSTSSNIHITFRSQFNDTTRYDMLLFHFLSIPF